jgi:hypothetical protein
MAILTVVITHLDAERAMRQLAYLRALAPEARFVLCHGGEREEFERLDTGDKVFVADPALRGPNNQQGYNELLPAVYERFVRDEPEVELAYVVEYDHLFLSGHFERDLAALAAARPEAGLFAKWASRRNDTNWPHFTRYRADPELRRFFARVSVREDPGQRWGCLGDGMLFRRDALEAFCSVTGAPYRYGEMFVPTLTHHLGFEVVDVDALGDLYSHVRWRPEFGVEEVLAAKRAGRAFVHPFKELDALDRVLQAESPAGAENSSTPSSSTGYQQARSSK